MSQTRTIDICMCVGPLTNPQYPHTNKKQNPYAPLKESRIRIPITEEAEKDASGSPRRASLLPARTAASSSRPASTSIQSTFCRCVLVASCGGGRSSPRFGDERQTIVVSLFALCMSGQAAAGHYHRAALLQPDLAHCAQPPEHHHRPVSRTRET